MSDHNKDKIASYYANGVGFAFSDNDCRLMFGKSAENNVKEINEEVEVYMTHKTLRLLATSANLLLDQFEKSSGKKIEIDQARIDAFRKVLESADEARVSPIA